MVKHYVQYYVFLNAAKTKSLLILIDLYPAEHLEEAHTSLKAESSLYVSKQSCSCGRKDDSVRLLLSIRLQYKALIHTL